MPNRRGVEEGVRAASPSPGKPPQPELARDAERGGTGCAVRERGRGTRRGPATATPGGLRGPEPAAGCRGLGALRGHGRGGAAAPRLPGPRCCRGAAAAAGGAARARGPGAVSGAGRGTRARPASRQGALFPAHQARAAGAPQPPRRSALRERARRASGAPGRAVLRGEGGGDPARAAAWEGAGRRAHGRSRASGAGPWRAWTPAELESGKGDGWELRPGVHLRASWVSLRRARSEWD